MPASSTTTEQQQSFQLHHTNSSSSSSSVVTVQRAGSAAPNQSTFSQSAVAQDQQQVRSTSRDGTNNPSNLSKLVTSPESRRRPSTTHSRSNSVSGVRDGVGNLNRWSQSTTSSKGSSAAPKRSNSVSRRMSFGGPGAFTFGLPTSQGSSAQVLVAQSPNRLPKTKFSTLDGSPSKIASSRQVDSASDYSNTVKSLPPLNAPPMIPIMNGGRSSPLIAATSTFSTAAVADYFGKSWDNATTQISTHSREHSKARSVAVPSPGGSTTIAQHSSPARRLKQEEELSSTRGHSRNHSQSAKSSSGTLSSRERGPKQPSQKAMLSKALQKANTAVLLDNAQNYEGAMDAYSEACNLLQLVMLRSSGDEDRRKLEAIRNTYATRIIELRKIAPDLLDDGKALPARPFSDTYRDDVPSSPFDEDDNEETAVIYTATAARIVDDNPHVRQRSRSIQRSQVPRRRDSLLPSPFDHMSRRPSTSSNFTSQHGQHESTSSRPSTSSNFTSQHGQHESFSKSSERSPTKPLNLISLAAPMDRAYMPPPLSPRRPFSPVHHEPAPGVDERQESADIMTPGVAPVNGLKRSSSSESMSWLNTIDESGGSTASSVHSRSSSLRLRRKHIRGASGATEAEFDAALDAAVEAAYDDGFEPDASPTYEADDDYDNELVANVRRRVELAKERVRETERETAIQLAQNRERSRLLQEERDRYEIMDADYDDNESEEEERMLEEMTRGYVMDDFEFGLQSKSALPRESDSSGFSGRTWNTSIGSNPTTGGTSLSTVAETSVLSERSKLLANNLPSLHPPPTQALPLPPPPTQALPLLPTSGNLQLSKISEAQSGDTLNASQGVRGRRLSGQNPKALKIETTSKSGSILAGPPTQPLPIPNIDASPVTTASHTTPPSRPPTANAPSRPVTQPTNRQASSPFPGPSPSEIITPPTPSLVQVLSNDSVASAGLPPSGSPGRPPSRAGLRKNFSTSSLKNMKSRNLSVSNIDDSSDISPITPGSFSGTASGKESGSRLPAMPALPTPIASAFRDKLGGVATGGLYLFNSDIHSPGSPGSSNSITDAPVPLEPCPNGFLLRPFWLMRALYQTIAHPRGGYLSNKLFVPRDVWLVKGVKIKGLEDKIASCDYLTAALQKLSRVDTYDADAVLDEIQGLEGVLEQVQVTLSRKLGNEVGVQGSGGLFKDAAAVNDGDSGLAGSKTSTQQSKSSFSWRRLRAKNSAVNLATTYTTKSVASDAPKEGLTMSTLPMTTMSNIRFAKRDISEVKFAGPNENYMAALARLFDAAQVIDQIARQVEDPGLRHADKTQVGLELSTRHAAEFFGFYICRFVLTDISLLLDKFIKRGSEWVLV